MVWNVNKYWLPMGDERKCPKCGAERQLRAGAVWVCPICGYVKRLESTRKELSGEDKRDPDRGP